MAKIAPSFFQRFGWALGLPALKPASSAIRAAGSHSDASRTALRGLGCHACFLEQMLRQRELRRQGLDDGLEALLFPSLKDRADQRRQAADNTDRGLDRPLARATNARTMTFSAPIVASCSMSAVGDPMSVEKPGRARLNSAVAIKTSFLSYGGNHNMAIVTRTIRSSGAMGGLMVRIPSGIALAEQHWI
jgi:hypothetical protein